MQRHYQLRVSNLRSSTIRLTLGGEMDMEGVPSVIDAILGAALANPTYEVCLDLREVAFVDSRGIAALIEASNRLAENGVRLAIEGASPAARKILGLTGTAAHLGVDGTSPRAGAPTGDCLA